ncbi:MAG: glycosyltransferase [bacterium]
MIEPAGLRVLFVSNMYPNETNPRSGIFVARQAESLVEAGVEVVTEPIAGVRGERDYLESRRRIRRLLGTFRPDIIHAHYGYTQVAVAGQSVGYVVTLYGDDLNGESRGDGGITLKSRIGIAVTQSFGLLARRILVQSRAMQARLWKGLRARSEVLGSGVDETVFSPAPRREARQRLGLADGRIVLAFVNSGGQPTKRLDLAMATQDELIRQGHDAQLLVAEKVPASEMRWYYQAADVLLMTSDFEGSPNCVKEALACGVPVVSVAVGDVPQVVTKPEQGSIVDRDPAALAQGVQRILRLRPDRRHSLLPHALRASTVAQRLIAIYSAARQ